MLILKLQKSALQTKHTHYGQPKADPVLYPKNHIMLPTLLISSPFYILHFIGFYFKFRFMGRRMGGEMV